MAPSLNAVNESREELALLNKIEETLRGQLNETLVLCPGGGHQPSFTFVCVRIIESYTNTYECVRMCLYIRPSQSVRIENSLSYVFVYPFVYVRISGQYTSYIVRIWKVYTRTQNNIRTQTYVHVYSLYTYV